VFVGGGMIAVLDAVIPAFIGRVVSLVSTHAAGALLHDAWKQLAGMAAVLLLARPAAREERPGGMAHLVRFAPNLVVASCEPLS
jgi:hypothetical protein